MTALRIGLASPLIPVEWLCAHGVHVLPRPAATTADAVDEGRCPYAAAMPIAGSDCDLLITAPMCDQLRRAGEDATALHQIDLPRAWRSPGAGRRFDDELDRLGRLLCRHGATPADPSGLAAAMEAAEARRHAALAVTGPGRVRAEALCAARASADQDLPPAMPAAATGPGIVLVGGPVRRGERWLYDAIEEAGAHLAFDATAWGERTLPRRFDRRLLRRDPREALRAAYADLPAAGHRPNAALFTWLRQAIARERPQALILVRQTWCDLWHAEEPRLRDWCGVPCTSVVLGDAAHRATTATRIQALIEMVA